MKPKIDFASILQTAIKVVTSPTSFFKEMPKTGGFIEPLVFMVVMGFIGGLIQAVFSIIGLHPTKLAIGVVSLIIMLTVAIVVSGFIAAAIYFVIWKLMGSQESFETAYRCNAYISALIPITAILNPIPYLAQIIAIVLTTLFLVIASVQVHNIPLKKAWLVFGILGSIFMMLSISGDIAVRRLKGTEMDMQKYMEEMQNTHEKAQKALEEI